MMNEMVLRSGTTQVGGSFAYVPQQAWVLNTTLEDNIVFGAPKNEEYYKSVIQACALETDF